MASSLLSPGHAGQQVPFKRGQQGEKLLEVYTEQDLRLAERIGEQIAGGNRRIVGAMVESHLVEGRQDLKPGMKLYGIPATRLAEELGRKMILNIVMVGFFAAVTKLVAYEAVREAVTASVPTGTEALNSKAFERGYQYGLSLK